MVVMSRRYRRHRYHKTNQNPRTTNTLGNEYLQIFENVARRAGMKKENQTPVLRALDWMSGKVNCEMCATMLVEISKDACCQRCFEMWVFLDDGRRCPFCRLPVKSILNRKQVDKLCGLVELKNKKLGKAGHFTQSLVRCRTQVHDMYIPN